MILYTIKREDLQKQAEKYLIEKPGFPAEVAEYIAYNEIEKMGEDVKNHVEVDVDDNDVTISILQFSYDEYDYYTLEEFNELAKTDFKTIEDFYKSEIYQNDDLSEVSEETAKILEGISYLGTSKNYIITAEGTSL